MKERKLSDWIISCISCQAINLHNPGNCHLYSNEVHSPRRHACEQAHIVLGSSFPSDATASTTRLDGKASILSWFNLAVKRCLGAQPHLGSEDAWVYP
ncbi:hypothetical protein T05_4244 [Trichinella murrelli]|uniref:Uncharacterized protein n=1 Tax=Trichinella murrelli TaxID=144512 RepID=A0A0V0T2Q9_9BILA|nr:hypothetical protein T05_4244 [Trichinella murrelli]